MPPWFHDPLWFYDPVVPRPHYSTAPLSPDRVFQCPHYSTPPRPLGAPFHAHACPCPPWSHAALCPAEGGEGSAGEAAAQPRGLSGGFGSTLGPRALLQPPQRLQSVPADGERCYGGDPTPQRCQPPSSALSPPIMLSAPPVMHSAPQQCSEPPSSAISPTPPSCVFPSQLQGCILRPTAAPRLPHSPLGLRILLWGSLSCSGCPPPHGPFPQPLPLTPNSDP